MKAQTEKFALLTDLGIVIVPDDYVHKWRLAAFRNSNRKKLYYFDRQITDKNFLNPSRILHPGNKLHVRAFRQVVKGTTTSEERMAFLRSQNTVFTGAQGLSLAFEQKREQLPKGKWYASFDEPDCLWQDIFNYHRVPNLNCCLDGKFEFYPDSFEDDWYSYCAFLCFKDA